jgi:hypothetical protein
MAMHGPLNVKLITVISPYILLAVAGSKRGTYLYIFVWLCDPTRVIIIIGTTAHFEPRPSSEASAGCPYYYY